MDIKKQFQSLRDTALQLSTVGDGAWHAEYGVRGNIIRDQVDSGGNDSSSDHAEMPRPGERYEYRRPLIEGAYRRFMERFLCLDGPQSYVIQQPLRTFGFSFAAASVGCSTPTESQENDLSGIGHSFIYGDKLAIERLARLVAAPAMRYLSSVSADGWVRKNSLDDAQESLGDWVYLIYEIGMEIGDPNLRRFYRLLTSFAGNIPGMGQDPIIGFEGHHICKDDIRQKRVREMIWASVAKKEIAFARLGTELTLASRIVLDHVLATKDIRRIGDAFYGKLRERHYYEWARQVELVNATNQTLEADAPHKGTINKAVQNQEIESNGKKRKKSLVNVHSYIAWLTKKKMIPHEEAIQVRNAIMGEIISRKK